MLPRILPFRKSVHVSDLSWKRSKLPVGLNKINDSDFFYVKGNDAVNPVMHRPRVTGRTQACQSIFINCKVVIFCRSSQACYNHTSFEISGTVNSSSCAAAGCQKGEATKIANGPLLVLVRVQ